MKRIALIKNSKVITVSLDDGLKVWIPDPYYDAVIDVTDIPQVGAGWVYDGSNFTYPAQGGDDA